jgi:hypothetical protein
VKIVGLSQKAHDKFGLRVMKDLLGSSHLLDAAFAHDHHPVRHLQRLFLIVRDENAGDVNFIVQPPQPGAQFLAHLRVQRPERFVEKQHLGLDRERPANATRCRCPPESCAGYRSAYRSN